MRIEFPGLFDLQVNGFGGVDFNAPDLTADRVEPRARADARHRRDALPADAHHLVVRASLPRARASSRGISGSGHRRDPHGRAVHLAGGRPARRASARARRCAASVDDFKRRQDAAGGRIVLVTLAPEVPGALPLIEQLVADRRARRASGIPPRRRGRSPTRLPPARRWRRISATAAHRCCRAIRTSSGSCWRPTRLARA